MSGVSGGNVKWPLRALAVAEMRPQGPTGRVGAGLWPGLPRDEARTFTLTGAQPPKRNPVICNDARDCLGGCFT